MRTDAQVGAAEPPGTSDLTQVGRGAMVSLVASVLGSVSGLGVVVILTRTLGPSRYGAVAVAVSVAGMVHVFTGLGLEKGAARMMAFAHAQGDEVATLRMFKAALLAGLATGLIGTLVMLVLGFGDVVGGPLVSTVILIMAPLVLAGGVRSSLYGALRAYRDLRALFYLGIAVPIIDFAMVGLLWVVGIRGLVGFATALVISAYIDLVLVSMFFLRGRKVGSLVDLTFEDAKRLVAFSLPLVVSQLMFFAIKNSDVLLLSVLRSTTEAGLYTPVMRLANSASKVMSAFPILFVPVATGYVALKQPEKLRDLYLTVTKWGYAFGFPIILVLVATPSAILTLLFGNEYAGMETVARLLSVGFLATVITGLNGATLGALGAVKEMAFYSAIGMAINLGIGFILIDRFGPEGAALSNTISYLFVNAAFSLILYRRAGITPFRRDAAALFLYSGLVLAVTTLVAQLPTFQATGPALAVSAAGVGVWLVGAAFLKPFHMEWGALRGAFRAKSVDNAGAETSGSDGQELRADADGRGPA